jgi:hypothetical protein
MVAVTVVLSWLDFLIIALIVCAAIYFMGRIPPRG